MLSMIEAILMNIPNSIKDLKSQNEKLNNELEEIRNENIKLKEEYTECFFEFEKLREENNELSKENQELDEYNDELLEKIEKYEREGKLAVERYVEDIFGRLVDEIADSVRKMDESDISYPSFDFDDYI